MSEYLKYQHVEKLGTDEVEGILDGLCYVYPKIDGTNAHIWRDKHGIKCGSRNRELSLEKDNAGFMEHIKDNEDQYLEFLNHFPEGTHVYGEWLVPHSLKTYRDDAWERFYVFDVLSPDGNYFYPEQYLDICEKCDIDVIHPIKIIENPRVERLVQWLEQNTYLIKDGEGAGEGLVIKNYEYENRYGRTVWAKLVTNAFKEKHVKEMGVSRPIESDVLEQKLVDKYLTFEIVDKVYQKIKVSEDGWSSKYISRLLSTTYHDFVNEFMWQIVRDNKNPKIDFKLIMKYCTLKVKELKPEVF